MKKNKTRTLDRGIILGVVGFVVGQVTGTVIPWAYWIGAFTGMVVFGLID